MLSRKVKVNPDNVATPIAASLGDLITLALLAGVGSLLFSSLGQFAAVAWTKKKKKKGNKTKKNPTKHQKQKRAWH